MMRKQIVVLVGISISYTGLYMMVHVPCLGLTSPSLLYTLHMHRRQRQYLRPLLPLELRRHDAANSRPNRLSRLIDQHAGIIVELDHTPVRSLPLLRRAHYDCMPYVASSDLVRGADGDGGALGAEVSLLLHDYYYTVACTVVLIYEPFEG
jgi:hypothetical protein